MENLNYLDAVLGGIVIISALIGLARGLLKEVLSLVAWIAAAYIAFLFAEQVADKYIVKFINDALISYLAAFGLLFLCVLFAIGLINLVITQLLNRTGMGGFDRMLGMLFGIARGAIIGALIVFVLSVTPAVKQSWWQSSILQPGFASLADWAQQQLPEDVQQILAKYTAPSSEQASPAVLRLERSAILNSEGRQATRPETMVEGGARNAISEMGEPEAVIQLESYDAQQPAPEVTKDPASMEKQAETESIAAPQQPPMLILESTQ